jgi:tetratricopeptide (TPR) repeat protein
MPLQAEVSRLFEQLGGLTQIGTPQSETATDAEILAGLQHLAERSFDAASACFAKLPKLAAAARQPFGDFLAVVFEGAVALYRSNFADATKLLGQSAVLADARLTSTPEDLSWLAARALTHELTGDLQRMQGQLQPALVSYRRAVSTRARMLNLSPDRIVGRIEIAGAFDRVAQLASRTGDHAGAEDASRRALSQRLRYMKSYPDDLHAVVGVQRAYVRHAALAEQDKLADQAFDSHKRALAYAVRAMKLAPLDQAVAVERGNVQIRYAATLVDRDGAAALDNARRGTSILVRQLKSDPDNASLKRLAGEGYFLVGRMHVVAKDIPQALDCYRRSLRLLVHAFKANPADLGGTESLGRLYVARSKLLLAGEDKAGALDDLTRGRKILARLCMLDGTRADLVAEVASCDAQLKLLGVVNPPLVVKPRNLPKPAVVAKAPAQPSLPLKAAAVKPVAANPQGPRPVAPLPGARPPAPKPTPAPPSAAPKAAPPPRVPTQRPPPIPGASPIAAAPAQRAPVTATRPLPPPPPLKR